MPRVKLSLPNERRKMSLKSAAMKHRVAIAEHKHRLGLVNDELKAMRPPRPPKDPL